MALDDAISPPPLGAVAFDMVGTLIGVVTAADTSAAELLLTATGQRPSIDPVVGEHKIGGGR